MNVIPQLSFSEAFNNATSKIFQFTGRSRRSEYWWAMALVYLASIFLTPFLGIFLSILTIPLTFRRLHDTGRSGWWWGIGAIIQFAFVLSLIYDVFMASTHANDLQGYADDLAFAFIAKYSIWLLIIGIYKIVLLAFMCLDSDQYENEYGASPKYIDDEELS